MTDTKNQKDLPSLLIIDDDVHFCDVLARTLEHKGWNVTTALDSHQAQEQLTENLIQYVVLDLKLSNESGLDLIQPILEKYPKCKILVLTGYASIATAVESIRRGAFNYLPKPTNADAIINALTSTQKDESTQQPSSKKSTTQQMDIETSPMSTERLEWEHIQIQLQNNNGNISATARALGMHRRTLQRKLNKKPNLR